MTSRTASGSRRSPSTVDSTTSAKRIVTVFRSSCTSQRVSATAMALSSAGAPATRLYTAAIVFDTLSDKLQASLSGLGRGGRLDEESVSKAMREVRLALLEADVNFEVAKDFTAAVKERALGQDVLRSLSPGQQVVKIVHEELTALMGSGDSRLAFGRAADRDPARGPPGLREDDHRREARAPPAQGGQARGARRLRPAAPGRDRPARAARRGRSRYRYTGSTPRTLSPPRATVSTQPAATASTW